MRESLEPRSDTGRARHAGEAVEKAKSGFSYWISAFRLRTESVKGSVLFYCKKKGGSRHEKNLEHGWKERLVSEWNDFRTIWFLFCTEPEKLQVPDQDGDSVTGGSQQGSAA